jgi:ribonucleoside-triphosphate reductase
LTNCKIEEQKENTNNYNSSANIIYEDGVKLHKQDIYKHLTQDEKNLFENNQLYMHDSEYFEITLNCVAISLEHIFKSGLVVNNIRLEKPTNIFEIFTQLNIFIINLENEISGGLTFVNFDHELAKLLKESNIPFPSTDELFLHIQSLFQVINFANSRFGNQSPYVSFTIGIVNNKESGLITQTVLNVLKQGASKGKPYIFPNIHFRVKSGINKEKTDPYYDLYKLSLKTTSYQMNPTYILADSEVNKNIDPLHLHTVGCRSRLLETTTGEKYGIGRTNIGAISINLPNIAMRLNDKSLVFEEIKDLMQVALNVLIKNQTILKNIKLKNAPTLVSNNLLYPFNNDIDSILDEASLAIGFIGFQEFSDILMPYNSIKEKHIFIDETLDFMANTCKRFSKEFNKIVTLIGVSGEGISYHFPKNDKTKAYSNDYQDILKKGFYTNSFHIPVYELVNPIEKISIEGSHHKYCNGGCISYIEISHVKENIEGFEDFIKIAENSNVHYLGFNFEKDICNSCGLETDSNKICQHCGSSDITEIRRVSGYLGYLNSFSSGKKLEENMRIRHTNIIKADDE